MARMAVGVCDGKLLQPYSSSYLKIDLLSVDFAPEMHSNKAVISFIQEEKEKGTGNINKLKHQ